MNDVPANVAAGTSVASAALAWVSQANEIASFLASVVAIIAGLYAIAHYRKSMRK
jgi:hypothetical protein